MSIAPDWIHALQGGVAIGAASSLLLLVNGRVAGVTGIFAGALTPRAPGFDWRALFLVGLLAGGALAKVLFGAAGSAAGTGVAQALAAGLLVGVGTRLANGCTSGHGVCGIARVSPRSLVATVTFIATGALTVFAMRRLA